MLKDLIDKIESYKFVCRGGTLVKCAEWVNLKMRLEQSANPPFMVSPGSVTEADLKQVQYVQSQWEKEGSVVSKITSVLDEMVAFDLSADDLALALKAVQMNLAWWDKQPGSGFKKQDMQNLKALQKKLDNILDLIDPPKEEKEFD